MVVVASKHYYVHDRNTSCQIKWCRAHDCFFFFLPDDESFFSITPHCISYSFLFFNVSFLLYTSGCVNRPWSIFTYHNFPWQLGAPQKHSFSGPKEVLNLQKTKQKRSYIGNIQILPGSGNNGRSSLQSSCSSTTRYNWKSRNAVKQQ